MEADYGALRRRQVAESASKQQPTATIAVSNSHMPALHQEQHGSALSATERNGGSQPSSPSDEFVETSLSEPLLEQDELEMQNREHEPLKEIVDESEEKWWKIALQVFFPYLVAGIGMVGAGMVLDKVQHWDVFIKVPELFIMVPALLGLKGNLEMTLASRLSTSANLGKMDSSSEQWRMIGGNLALTQAQALVVGFLASVVAMVFAWIPQGKFDLFHGFLISVSSVVTASLASLVLGSIMIMVVLFSRKCGINPDNVATPIAASLGDLTTLAVLAGFATLFHMLSRGGQHWLNPLVLVSFLLSCPLWCYISHRNKYVHDVLYTGWTPVIGAMIISSMGGLILDFAVSQYTGIAVYQPVINGVGGNLVAVQASRMSTSLHRKSSPGEETEESPSRCPNPLSVFCAKGMDARTARVLLLLVFPGQIIFMVTIHLLQLGHTALTPLFAACYLTAAFLQVAFLLYVSVWMVNLLWRHGNDPDNFAIPYLTALGDLVGTGLLALVFLLLHAVGDQGAA